ncbi:ATP-binding cassette sub-family B member 7, mitochondrial, partial [Dictyocoela roeselum]
MVSNFTILKEIYFKYVLGIRFIRLMIGPTLICMLFARYLEVKLGEIMQRVSAHIDIPFSTSCSSLVWKYFMVTSISCLLIELQGFIFTGPIQRAFREASKNAFFHIIKMEHSEFNKLGMGEVHATIERKSQAVSEILDVLILNFMPVTFVLLFASYKVYEIIGLVSAIILNLTLFLYAFVTIKIATWRNKIRKDVNMAINDASNRLYDRLSNYE